MLDLAMVKKEEIRSGVILRVLSHHLGTPLNAIATVETVEASERGGWNCTVQYDNKRIANRRWLYRSCLWESDLGGLEIVTDLNEIVEPSRRNQGQFRPVTSDVQYRLPFKEE